MEQDVAHYIHSCMFVQLVDQVLFVHDQFGPQHRRCQLHMEDVPPEIDIPGIVRDTLAQQFPPCRYGTVFGHRALQPGILIEESREDGCYGLGIFLIHKS
jgi:hypothetical protein